MLCHDCEEMFSSYEVKFASDFLDKYLKCKKLGNIKSGIIQNYILTVAWRVLWDDLYRLDSHQGHFARNVFEQFASDLGEYLLNIGKANNCRVPSKFINKVYKLEKLIDNKAINQMAEGCLFGYSVYFPRTNTISVIVFYAGLVFVTDYCYDKNKFMFIGGGRSSI